MDKRKAPELGGIGGTQNRRRDALRFIALTAITIIYYLVYLSIAGFVGGL